MLEVRTSEFETSMAGGLLQVQPHQNRNPSRNSNRRWRRPGATWHRDRSTTLLKTSLKD